VCPVHCDPNITQASKSANCESLRDSDVDGQMIFKWILGNKK